MAQTWAGIERVPRRRLGGVATGALLGGGLWALAIIGWGLADSGPVRLVPVAPHVRQVTGGTSLLVPVGLGLLASVVVVSALLATSMWGGWPAFHAAAWVVTGLGGVVALAGALTVGVFVLPVAVGCAVACAAAGRPGPTPDRPPSLYQSPKRAS
jgi:hypothetical protein